jgi:hypothetical protein
VWSGVFDLQERAPAGSRLSWETVWHIIAPGPSEPLKMFAHVLDAQNQVVAGDDRIDVNVATLLPGDLIRHISLFQLPSGLAPGNYRVEVGWYQPESGARLRQADGTDYAVCGKSFEVSAP